MKIFTFKLGQVVTISFLLHGILFSQTNLVPNGSFEDYSNCPINIATFDITQFEKCVGWTSPNGGSPDYYNSCANNGYFCDVPKNNFGYQFAKTGEGYVGIVLISEYNEFEDYREYVQVQLTNPLENSKEYMVKFHISKADKNKISSNKLGVLFSNNPISNIDSNLIQNTSILKNLAINYLSDTLSWVEISGTYEAAGSEQYLIIGNFNSSAETAKQYETYGLFDEAYIYIDDVSVQEYQSNNINDVSHEAVYFFYDQVNNVIKTSATDYIIYDLKGSSVYVSTENNSKVFHFEKGIYFIRIYDEIGKIITKKIIVY